MGKYQSLGKVSSIHTTFSSGTLKANKKKCYVCGYPADPVLTPGGPPDRKVFFKLNKVPVINLKLIGYLSGISMTSCEN